MQEYDLVIIGGGAAGLMAAITAKEKGIEDILIIERECVLGGALNEYIHNGFGLIYCKGEITGPEFAQRLITDVEKMGIHYKLNTLVLTIDKEKAISFVNSNDGVVEIRARSIILALGCRERPRGAMGIPKTRCAGIITAGSAHKFVNMEGYLPGKEVVILGSGDLGAIMSRRLTIEGAKVRAVVEHMPYVTACDRNITECFEDFNIPLMLSHTVIEIKGKDRVEGVIVAQVDKDRKPIAGTERHVRCDCLLLSLGLFPENELIKKAGINFSSITRGPEVDDNMETSIRGIFACGSVVHVHNIVDNVIEESKKAAISSAEYLKGNQVNGKKIKVIASDGIKYTIPNYINPDNIIDCLQVFFKVDDRYENKHVSVYFDKENQIKSKESLLAVGNIESFKLTKEMFNSHSNCANITVKIEN